MLQRLPGRKIIFSNAPRHYTRAILRITGLEPIFDAVTIETLRFRPNRWRPVSASCSGRTPRPRRCIMVEDSLANLITAKRLGMKTVWVSTGLRNSPY